MDEETLNECEKGSLLFLFGIQYKSIPINSGLASILTINFIQHIIFMRKQIPCTYVDLVTHAKTEHERRQQQQKGRRLTANFQKKSLRFVNDIEFAFASISQHFLKIHPKKVAILFGSSINNPKEGFMLDFLNSTGGAPYEYTNKQRDQAVRKLIRSIFTNGSNVIFQTELKRPWNMFFLCYGNRLIDGVDESENKNDNETDLDCEYDDHHNIGFVPMENFKIKKPRSKRSKPIFQITLNGLENGEIGKNGDDDCNMMDNDNKDLVWYKFAKRIKGIKNPPEEREKKRRS
jgi:hypothetical protein